MHVKCMQVNGLENTLMMKKYQNEIVWNIHEKVTSINYMSTKDP